MWRTRLDFSGCLIRPCRVRINCLLITGTIVRFSLFPLQVISSSTIVQQCLVVWPCLNGTGTAAHRFWSTLNSNHWSVSRKTIATIRNVLWWIWDFLTKFCRKWRKCVAAVDNVLRWICAWWVSGQDSNRENRSSYGWCNVIPHKLPKYTHAFLRAFYMYEICEFQPLLWLLVQLFLFLFCQFVQPWCNP